MKIEVNLEKKYFYLLAILLVLTTSSFFVIALIDPTAPNHPLQQVSINAASTTSVDENNNGRIDNSDLSANSLLLEGADLATVLAQPSGGGFPTFRIASAGSSTGNIGRGGLNAICESAFGAGAVMYGTQHLNCYRAGSCILDFRVTTQSWFDRTLDTIASTSTSGNSNGWTSGDNCDGWTSSGGLGSTVLDSGLTSVEAGCATPRPVACAAPV